MDLLQPADRLSKVRAGTDGQRHGWPSALTLSDADEHSCESAWMVRTVCVIVNASDREGLEVIALNRNQLHKHVERARAVLAAERQTPVR